MNKASGFLMFLQMHREVKDTAKLAPAESPAIKIWSGSIPKDL